MRNSVIPVIKSHLADLLVLVVAPLAALAWTGPSMAASSCLNDNLDKLCLEITSIPGDSVQPSGISGDSHGNTYVKYSAVFRNAGQTSTRHITLTFQLSTAAGFSSYTADPNLGCTQVGGTIRCALDKFEAFKAYSVTAYALPPPYTGASTPTSMSNTGTYGWNGNTKSTVQTIAVSPTSGRSYVPANTSVSLVTSPQASDPTQQVTPENPLWARITLPARPNGYFASVYVQNEGPDNSADCTGGLYASSDGNLYVCRDTAKPTRWIQYDLPSDLFTADDPFEVLMYWDASIVPSTQLPPNAIAPTGLPKWAIFHNQTETGVPYGRSHAFSNVCDSTAPVAPCLNTVEQLGSGDYRADFLKPNDGSDMSGGPLLPLARVLDWIIHSADAVSIGVGGIMK